ncbi:MAG: hydroxyisourate hydrolase [Gammaproteobacteria bacterium]|nr:hydroxyisourate hydrolase [Gammaproteobacteria bacterium]
MGRLTTHVLDTARGLPAAGVEIALYRVNSELQQLKCDRTNADGRLNNPILDADEFITGVYELVFQAGEYFRGQDLEISEPLFVDEVVLRFGINDANQHYHVPLLVSPWAYSTYRGS